MSPNLKRLLTVADRRLAVVAETRTNLKTRFLELRRLREQVRSADLRKEAQVRRPAPDFIAPAA
jgi:hypothetical protein